MDSEFRVTFSDQCLFRLWYQMVALSCCFVLGVSMDVGVAFRVVVSLAFMCFLFLFVLYTFQFPCALAIVVGIVSAWFRSSVCVFCCFGFSFGFSVVLLFFCGTALRVHPAVTRLTVYRRLYVLLMLLNVFVLIWCDALPKLEA